MIAPETIALVRDRTDIVAVLSESMPSLKRRGRSFVGLCPFHKEKTPSFHVNPDRGFFHCFGCKESGTVIDFLMKHDGYSFPETVRVLAERAGITIEEEKSQEPDAAQRQRRQKDDLFALNNLAASYFESCLRDHPMRAYAEEELARRGLSATDDVVQAFRIGYAPPGWDGLATFLKAQSMSPVLGEAVGLLVPRSGGSGYYDRFRHRLMFSVIDAQGHVLAFSGRVLPDPPGTEAKNDGPPPKYINSPESPVYTKGNALFGLYQARHTIRSEELAVLVEGNFDVVSLHARGFTNVVAPLGTAFTIDQAKLLKRFTPRVTMLFDGDAAGRKATRLSREPCRIAGLEARVAILPDGVDPDDFARTNKAGIEGLVALVKGAAPMLEHLIKSALDETFVQADAHERAMRVTEVSKLLSEEDEPLVRMLAKAHADSLAGRLDIVRASPDAFRALEQTVKRALASAAPYPGMGGADPRSARIRAKPPGSVERREIIGALIDYPELLDDPEVPRHLDLLEGFAAQTVAAIAKTKGQGEKGLDTALFLAQIPDPIQAFARERLAAPAYESLQEARASLIEFATRLKKLVLARETTELAREQGRSKGDWETGMELAQEANAKARNRHGMK